MESNESDTSLTFFDVVLGVIVGMFLYNKGLEIIKWTLTIIAATTVEFVIPYFVELFLIGLAVIGIVIWDNAARHKRAESQSICSEVNPVTSIDERNIGFKIYTEDEYAEMKKRNSIYPDSLISRFRKKK